MIVRRDKLAKQAPLQFALLVNNSYCSDQWIPVCVFNLSTNPSASVSNKYFQTYFQLSLDQSYLFKHAETFRASIT